MRQSPNWLINIAAAGMGLFALVIVFGLLSWVLGRMFGSVPGFASAILFVLLAIIAGMAAYYMAKYCRRFMLRHVARVHRAVTSADPSSEKMRLARALVFSGIAFFLLFIFGLISGIMNTHG